MKQFEITPDIQEFEIKGQKFSEKYSVYRLKDISETGKWFWLNEGYNDKNDILLIVKDSE